MLRTPMKSALTFAGLVLATLALASCTARAESKPAPAAAPSEPSTSPRSVFVIDPTTSKDPFYPKSKRFEVIAPKTNDAVIVYQPLFPEEIRCQGFSGTTDKRLAIVNNRTMEKGEEFDLTLKTGQRVHVRCLEVKEKSVLLEVNGIARELGLRANLQ
jgi:hypothetical protein